uniref:ShKT domain-containing protein n=1 Tax=Corethron hystrix TaxID=216773 RepID=A0A7S1BGJ3_9STRA
MDCTDDINFVSTFGLRCKGYMGWNCENLIFVGFTPKEQDYLIESCPYSCGLCGKVTRKLPEPTSYPTAVPTGIPTFNCVDDISFRNRFNQGCDAYNGIVCEGLSLLGGFSKDDVRYLLKKCPKTCNICIDR